MMWGIVVLLGCNVCPKTIGAEGCHKFVIFEKRVITFERVCMLFSVIIYKQLTEFRSDVLVFQ
jgi:hypothetical protein